MVLNKMIFSCDLNTRVILVSTVLRMKGVYHAMFPFDCFVQIMYTVSGVSMNYLNLVMIFFDLLVPLIKLLGPVVQVAD